jgi:ABC-type Fe3+-hydroxamate transport system substrate-binding protein
VKRRRLFGALLALLAPASLSACRRDPEKNSGARVVSLSPSITETLFAIGAGPDVVAISDYCDSPKEALGLPRVGTSITPNYEAIARLRPKLILSEANVSARRRELAALAPTRLLPWLALDEITASMRELGRLVGHVDAASALAERLHARLDVPEPANGPRVLLLLGEGDARELWFVRRNSLHGAALRAAGARNAVAEDIQGPPQLSQERLLELDPDAIVVLTRPGQKKPGAGSGFARLPTLQAVKNGRVSLLETPEAFANGPRILGLADRLGQELVRLGLVK